MGRLPLSWRYNLNYTASRSPSFDAIHVALEILEFFHSWLKDRYAPLSEWIIVGVKVVSSVGVWGMVGVVEAVEMVGLHNDGSW